MVSDYYRLKTKIGVTCLLLCNRPSGLKYGNMRLLQRYYEQLQDISERHGNVAWVQVVATTLQLVTLLVPMKAGDYSWDYEQLGFVWKLVNAVVRPDLLLVLCKAPEWLIAALLIAAFLSRLAAGLLVSLQLHHTEASEFESSSLAIQPTTLCALLDFSLAVAVSGLLWLPTLCFFTSVSFDVSHETLIRLCGGMGGLLLVSIATADRVYMSDPMWRVSGLGSIQPHSTLLYAVLDMVPAFITSAVPYSHNDMFIRLFTVPVCMLKLVHVYRKKPYQSEIGNDVLSFQALVLILTLLLLYFHHSNSLIFPSITFLILFPVIYTANALTRRYLYTPPPSSHQFHLLLHSIVDQASSLQDIEPLAACFDTQLQAFPLPTLPLQSLLEAAYFYQLANNRYLMRVAVAMLGEHHPGNIAAGICITRLLSTLNARTSRKMVTADEVVAKYIDFAICRSLLTDSDRISMQLLRSFYDKLISGADSFEQLVRLVRLLDYQLHRTEKMYKRSIKMFEKKASLVRAYKSFLYVIGRKEKVVST